MKFWHDRREGRERRILRENAGNVLVWWESEPELTLHGAIISAGLFLAAASELHLELGRRVAPHHLSDYPSYEVRELLLDIHNGRERQSTECVSCGRRPPPDRISAGWIDLESLTSGGSGLPANPVAIQRRYERFAERTPTGVMCSECIDVIELAELADERD